jgi:hypothetical protein
MALSEVLSKIWLVTRSVRAVIIGALTFEVLEIELPADRVAVGNLIGIT